MPIRIVVPDLGESIVEATISRWLKQKGDYVAAGEAIVELETDKVNLEVTAEQAGILARIERQAGEDVQIGNLLGLIETTPEDGQSEPPDKKTKASPKQRNKEADQEKEEVAKATAEKATPLAKRLAQEHGIDIGQVPSESGERLTKEDIGRYLEQQAVEAKAKKEEPAGAEPQHGVPARETRSASSSPADHPEREERVRMSRRRQTIAGRLVEAQQTAAMLTTFNEIDMHAVIELRRRRLPSFQERHGIRLGFMSFFVKAAIGTLRQFPQLNAEIDGNEIVLKYYYDIGMAIGAEEGLVVPVIRNADRLTFAEIEQSINDYAQKVKEGSLSVPDLRGGTFTITNGGVFGSLLSTPILNPPQVGILGLHKIEKRPVALNDEIVIRPMMYVALSYDHRIVDGREAVQFLVRLKELIEDPEILLLEG